MVVYQVTSQMSTYYIAGNNVHLWGECVHLHFERQDRIGKNNKTFLSFKQFVFIVEFHKQC